MSKPFGGNPCSKKKTIAKLVQITKKLSYTTSGGLGIPKQNAFFFGNTTQQGLFKDDMTTFSFLIYHKSQSTKRIF